jgi:Xaa-Pro aminopeptidase
LEQAMRDRGVDLCVVAASDNLRYLTGYDGMAVDRLTALIVSPAGAAMIIPDFDAAEFEAVATTQTFPWSDRTGPAGAVAAAFDRVGGATSSVLVDEELPFAFFAGMRDRLGASPDVAGTLFGELRLRKHPDEVEAITLAGELVSRAIDLASEIAQPGMTELGLRLRLEQEMWNGGADSVDYVLVQAGPNSASAHHNADRTPLRAGEPVLVDVAVRLNGYYADITGNVFLGEPSEDYLKHYEIVHRAEDAGVQAAVAGATAHDVSSAATAVILEAGLQRYMGSRTGHGLGAGVHEPPSIVEGNHQALPVGTVLTVEPGLYLPGRYGIRIEDTVAVTDDGPRRLTRGLRPLAIQRLGAMSSGGGGDRGH